MHYIAETLKVYDMRSWPTEDTCHILEAKIKMSNILKTKKTL